MSTAIFLLILLVLSLVGGVIYFVYRICKFGFNGVRKVFVKEDVADESV